MLSNRKLKRKQREDVSVSVAELSQDQEKPALTQVYCGENPIVDIVAVHGITGDSIKTFTYSENKCFWLGDADMLPRDISNSRVLTYSYPADVASVFKPACADTIMHIAQTLVAELVADREAQSPFLIEMEDATERPIIFVCHSLGGIIVKRALIYSNGRTSHKIQHLHSIFVSTYAIVFLGTPHLGSGVANLFKYVERLVHTIAPSLLVDTTPQLLNALKEGSEILQEITDGFVPLMQTFRIYFFWEQVKTKLGVTYDYVVSSDSAAPILPDTERAGLKSDHSHICKFASRESHGYKIVMVALRRYAREAPGIVSRRWEQEREFMQALRRNEANELLR